MSRRALVAIAFVAAALAPWSARDARAQERVDIAALDAAPAFVTSLAQPIRLGDLEQIPLQISRPPARKPGSSAILGSLYASTALLQGLDVHSTLKAFDAGAVEANPVMAGIAKNRGAFIAVKAAVAASTILAARQMGKRNKVAAVVTLVAINSAYAMVVRHNYKVARGIK